MKEKFKENMVGSGFSGKTAEDIQDRIFQKMSVEESIRFSGELYQFGRMLNKLGNHYDGARKTASRHRKNTR